MAALSFQRVAKTTRTCADQPDPVTGLTMDNIRIAQDLFIVPSWVFCKNCCFPCSPTKHAPRRKICSVTITSCHHGSGGGYLKFHNQAQTPSIFPCPSRVR